MRSFTSIAREDLESFTVEGVAGAKSADAVERHRLVVAPLAPPSVTSAATALHQYVAGLVQRLFVSAERPDDVVHWVVFAGVEAGHQSSLLTAAAAEVLATCVAGSICIVDANLAAPSLHRHYEASNDTGLTQFLAGTGPVHAYATALGQGRQSALWLLPAGSASAGGSTPIATESSHGRLRELLRTFDYVLIDAPPITQQPEASLLGAQVDGVVLVAEANVTRRHVARAAAERLRTSGARVLGTILNNRTFPIPEAVYRRL